MPTSIAGLLLKEPVDTADYKYASKTWQSFLERFQQCLTTDNAQDFLQWSVVKNTMFSENQLLALSEIHEMAKDPLFIRDWLPALAESPVGNPDLFASFPITSTNRIHKTHHLWSFAELTGVELNTYGQFVEIGAGYGLLPVISRNLGLTAPWILIDFELIGVLQKWYLEQNQVSRTKFVSPARLSESSHFNPEAKTLLVSTWAISEVPLDLRRRYLQISKGWDYLFAYQAEFDDVDNEYWFKEIQESDPDRYFYSRDIPNLPGHKYLFGICR